MGEGWYSNGLVHEAVRASLTSYATIVVSCANYTLTTFGLARRALVAANRASDHLGVVTFREEVAPRTPR
jgi:hypothetical protein